MATKWKEPPKDALDTLTLGAVDIASLATVEQLHHLPFDPVKNTLYHKYLSCLLNGLNLTYLSGRETHGEHNQRSSDGSDLQDDEGSTARYYQIDCIQLSHTQ